MLGRWQWGALPPPREFTCSRSHYAVAAARTTSPIQLTSVAEQMPKEEKLSPLVIPPSPPLSISTSAVFAPKANVSSPPVVMARAGQQGAVVAASPAEAAGVSSLPQRGVYDDLFNMIGTEYCRVDNRIVRQRLVRLVQSWEKKRKGEQKTGRKRLTYYNCENPNCQAPRKETAASPPGEKGDT